MRSISLVGSNFWQTGAFHNSYSIPVSGEISTNYLEHGHTGWIRRNAINELRKTAPSDHILMSAFSEIHNNAVDNNQALGQQLAAVPESVTVFPDIPLAQQLKAVSKLMEIGRSKGLRRQMFFVGLGGFDTHNGQNASHPNLMGMTSDAMASFYNYTVEKGLDNNVTAFTMSDFGRTLRPNGDGTDHGWAGHQLILGGAVAGGRIYGDMPFQTPLTSLVPTTSNEQMFAALAKWYGVNDDAILKEIFPNLKNFGSSNINYFV